MELTLGEEKQITTWHEALTHVSELAHARLPVTLHGAIERATALCIHRHVWFDEDGKHAQVRSSDGSTYYLVNAHCTCMDVTRAPQGLCKHRLAVALYRRASELLAASHVAPTPAAVALPEAPASANARVLIGRHEVQLTLRDTDEERLLVRLAALLARYPAAACGGKTKSETASAPAPTSGETPICPVHGPLKQSTKAPGTWFCSKKNFDGSYCQSRHPAK